MHTVVVVTVAEMNVALPQTTEPNRKFCSVRGRSNRTFGWIFGKMRHYFSTLAPGRGPFPSKFPKFGLQNLPNKKKERNFCRRPYNSSRNSRSQRELDRVLPLLILTCMRMRKPISPATVTRQGVALSPVIQPRFAVVVLKRQDTLKWKTSSAQSMPVVHEWVASPHLHAMHVARRAPHFFLFVQWSQNAGVDASTVVNRREAASGQIYRERLSISGNRAWTGSSSHHTGLSFGPTRYCRYHRPTQLQFRTNQIWRKRETDKHIRVFRTNNAQAPSLFSNVTSSNNAQGSLCIVCTKKTRICSNLPSARKTLHQATDRHFDLIDLIYFTWRKASAGLYKVRCEAVHA